MGIYLTWLKMQFAPTKLTSFLTNTVLLAQGQILLPQTNIYSQWQVNANKFKTFYFPNLFSIKWTVNAYECQNTNVHTTLTQYKDVILPV